MSRSGLIFNALGLCRHCLDNTHGRPSIRQISDCAIAITCTDRLKIIAGPMILLPNSRNDRVLILLVTNYQNRTGEVDLIMIDDQTLVFVEIKQRRDTRFVRP